MDIQKHKARDSKKKITFLFGSSRNLGELYYIK